MMFKKYWGGAHGKCGFPRDLMDYIFVRFVAAEVTRLFCSCIETRHSALATASLPRLLQYFFTAAALTLFVSGCRLAPVAPVNLQEGGWKLREGQAVWKRNKDAPEIAGDVMLATRRDGSTFVQFTKTPFPMIIAQTTTNRWQIEIPMQNKRYSGPGSPPKRLIWAYLPGLLAGEPPPKGWSWNILPDNGWRLENFRSGEMLQGYLSPSAK